ncbi:winged helix-turn-helix domain-containing protein [Streptomyces sp. NPDC057052]|uniref:winged helix-turn-helix domain-containing protein n=1 Tax=Streptomyces sp. NPDC057052 TaxID=3346010 RepID=UPI0036367E0A
MPPTVIRRCLRLSLSVATVWRLLKRHGWFWQAPARRVLERDEYAVETVRLPPYAPDLDHVEAVWSLVRGAMADTAFDTPDGLERPLHRELHRIQLRSHPQNLSSTASSQGTSIPKRSSMLGAHGEGTRLLPGPFFCSGDRI